MFIISLNTIIAQTIIYLSSKGFLIFLFPSLHSLNKILGNAIQFLAYSSATHKVISCFAFSLRNLFGFLFVLNQQRIHQ